MVVVRAPTLRCHLRARHPTAAAAGSARYHLSPNTATLAWDRLGMCCTFASLLAAVIAQLRSAAAGLLALAPLLAAACGSVLWWQASEAAGRGDLCWYALVQGLAGESAKDRALKWTLNMCSQAQGKSFCRTRSFMPALAHALTCPPSMPPLPCIWPPGAAAAVGYHALAYPSPRGSSRHILASLALYGAAIVCDRLDRPVYLLTMGLVSGHTIKHLLAGAAGWTLVAALRQRILAPVAGQRA